MAIQSTALRLFREQGYEETTVQQIIEEVEISESTFFRYFPTKADVVLSDEFDPVIVEAFRSQPAALSSIQALRAAARLTFCKMAASDGCPTRSHAARGVGARAQGRHAGPVRLHDGAARDRGRADRPSEQ